MAKIGFTRIPYYPQLKAIFKEDATDKALVLSLILYWSSRDLDSFFDLNAHTRQIAVHLSLNTQFVINTIDELLERQIIYIHKFKQEQKNKEPFDALNYIKQVNQKKDKIIFKVLVNYVTLSKVLEHQHLNIKPKLLSYAGDDFFDLYDVITEQKVHFTQGILGILKGKDFEEAAIIVAKILHYLVNNEEEFIFKSLAPGWKMLINPPATINDIASRFVKDDERAIDLGFTDGNFFMPDGNEYGSRYHYVIQKQKSQKEAKILVASILLGICTVSNDLHFISDLQFEELKPAFNLLYRCTKRIARLDLAYFDNLYLSEEQKLKLLASYQQFLSNHENFNLNM